MHRFVYVLDVIMYSDMSVYMPDTVINGLGSVVNLFDTFLNVPDYYMNMLNDFMNMVDSMNLLDNFMNMLDYYINYVFMMNIAGLLIVLGIDVKLLGLVINSPGVPNVLSLVRPNVTSSANILDSITYEPGVQAVNMFYSDDAQPESLSNYKEACEELLQ